MGCGGDRRHHLGPSNLNATAVTFSRKEKVLQKIVFQTQNNVINLIFRIRTWSVSMFVRIKSNFTWFNIPGCPRSPFNRNDILDLLLFLNKGFPYNFLMTVSSLFASSSFVVYEVVIWKIYDRNSDSNKSPDRVRVRERYDDRNNVIWQNGQKRYYSELWRS